MLNLPNNKSIQDLMATVGVVATVVTDTVAMVAGAAMAMTTKIGGQASSKIMERRE